MKLKLTLLTVFCLLLFACPSTNDDETPQVEVTEDNYLFEGEITKQYFIQQLNLAQENQEGIEIAQNNLDNYNEFLGGLGGIIGPILPPPPPCPDSDNGILCIPTEGLFIFPDGIEALFRILDENGEPLTDEIFDDFQTLPNSQGQLNYFSYTLDEGLEGPVMLEITRFGEGVEGEELTLSINAGIRQ